MKLSEHVRIRWAWRRRRFALPGRRFALPGRRDRDAAAPYGYALPRDGLAPAAVVAIVAAALAAGGWLGTQTGTGGGAAADPTALLDVGAPASAGAASGTDGRDAIAALNTSRADGRRDLATAKRSSEQAAAALGLRRSHLRAAARFEGVEPALAVALRRNARAYAKLAHAAEEGDRRGFVRASTAVTSAERDLERLIGSVL